MFSKSVVLGDYGVVCFSWQPQAPEAFLLEEEYFFFFYVSGKHMHSDDISDVNECLETRGNILNFLLFFFKLFFSIDMFWTILKFMSVCTELNCTTSTPCPSVRTQHSVAGICWPARLHIPTCKYMSNILTPVLLILEYINCSTVNVMYFKTFTQGDFQFYQNNTL